MSKQAISIPSSFIIDVLWDCNYNCPMCVKRTLKTPCGQKPLKDLLKLVDKLTWTKFIKIGALGDPFMYKGLDKALKYLNNKNIVTPLTTNASLINEDNIKSLPRNNQLFVSIDGGSEEIYKRVRGHSLKEIKKNLLLVKRKRPDIVIGFNCLLFNFNILDAKKLVDFASLIGASISFFFPMYFKPSVEKKMSAYNLGNDLISQMMTLARYAEDKQVRYVMTSPFVEERPCLRSLMEPIVAYDGTVYPCDYVYQDMNNWDHPTWKSYYLGKPMEVPQYQYKMGNLYKEDFRKMWRSDKWKQLRRNIIKMNVETLNKPFIEVVEETDLSIPLEHCKVCLSRWSICL